MVNLGVLVSGRGTNLQAIIDAIESKSLTSKIKVVVSDKPDAYAIERARQHAIPVEVIKGDRLPSKKEYDKKLVEVFKGYGVELVVLAGFMRILTGEFIKAFPMRIMNIHPSLLPSFPGLDVQRKALDWGVRFSGCTVHFVSAEVDSGPIILQAAVPVLDDDTVESLSQRILSEEHRIYPEAIRLFSEGRLEVRGRRVLIKAKGSSGKKP
jgi:phosphoribosylglycinamide formyltransferase-1